jgi:hypothetical protein
VFIYLFSFLPSLFKQRFEFYGVFEGLTASIALKERGETNNCPLIINDDCFFILQSWLKVILLLSEFFM